MKKDVPGGSDRRQFIKKSAAVGLGVGVGLSLAKEALQPKTAKAQEGKAVRWGMVIDLLRCTGCAGCAVACKVENDVRLGVFGSSVTANESGTTRAFQPWLCNHCAKPACVQACPVEPRTANLKMPDGSLIPYAKRASYQRPDGLVLVDQERCIGCGKCVDACPYGARFLDPAKRAGGDPSKGAADSCTFCEHRLRDSFTPACVDTCPASARVFGDLNDPDSDISKLKATTPTSVLGEEFGTEPQVYYVGQR